MYIWFPYKTPYLPEPQYNNHLPKVHKESLETTYALREGSMSKSGTQATARTYLCTICGERLRRWFQQSPAHARLTGRLLIRRGVENTPQSPMESRQMSRFILYSPHPAR